MSSHLHYSDYNEKPRNKNHKCQEMIKNAHKKTWIQWNSILGGMFGDDLYCYHIEIKFCPFCGLELEKEEDG